MKGPFLARRRPAISVCREPFFTLGFSEKKIQCICAHTPSHDASLSASDLCLTIPPLSPLQASCPQLLTAWELVFSGTCHFPLQVRSLKDRFSPTSVCNSDLFTSISTWVSRRNLGAACLRLNDLSCLSLFLVIILSWLEVLPSTVSPKVEIWEPFFIPTCISLPVSYQCSSPWKVTPLSRLHHRLTSSLVLLKVAILCHLTACCKVSGISPRLF